MKEKVYEFLTTIPKGKVVTYGDIANYFGNVHYARVIGNILHQNPNPEMYPCYKVVNGKGELSSSFAFGGIDGQKCLLEKEGIEVNHNKVDLKRYRYFI